MRSFVFSLALLSLLVGLVLAQQDQPDYGIQRGNKNLAPCSDDARCNQIYAVGYFGSAVTAATCTNGNCKVTCKPGWDTSSDGAACTKGSEVNICGNFVTAFGDGDQAHPAGCQCLANPPPGPGGACTCPAGQVFKLKDGKAVCEPA